MQGPVFFLFNENTSIMTLPPPKLSSLPLGEFINETKSLPRQAHTCSKSLPIPPISHIPLFSSKLIKKPLRSLSYLLPEYRSKPCTRSRNYLIPFFIKLKECECFIVCILTHAMTKPALEWIGLLICQPFSSPSADSGTATSQFVSFWNHEHHQLPRYRSHKHSIIVVTPIIPSADQGSL